MNFFMKFLLALITICLSITCYSQKVIPLYNDSIPNSKGRADEEKSETDAKGILRISKVTQPTLTVYLPDKQNTSGTAVIICPGGGYSILAAGHEGHDVAKRFNEMGVTAFVLKYRLPDEQTMHNKEIGPLQDAQRAIQLVRTNASEWKIDKNRIGIMGFSAGGHLASAAGTNFKHSYIENKQNTNLRPDFMILIYPVISLDDSIGHKGSRERLLGNNPSAEKILKYSNHTKVTSETPTTFLVHAKDDGVSIHNSLVFAEALKKNKVAYRIHVYEKGGHGYGMNNPTSDVKWMDLVERWLREKEWLKTKNRR
jgi:acetyl esterase/lipase